MTDKKSRTPVVLYVGVILLCVTLLLTYLVMGIYARYSTKASTGDSANVAAWVFELTGEGSTAFSFDLTDMNSPGDTKEIAFYITNTKNTRVCEVDQAYNVIVESTGNLPFTYTLTAAAPAVGTAAAVGVASGLGVAAENGMLPAAESATHTYTLTISWPADLNSFTLHEEVDLVSVTVESVQVD